MNITFILGNGFDINIGLQTRYKNFYDYYKTVTSENELINELKKEIDKDYDNWADLEQKLGDYTKDIASTDDFEVIFEDILDELSNYIETEQKKYSFDDENAKKKFIEDLNAPTKHLTNADRESLDKHIAALSNGGKSNYYINILTFNYTYCAEQLAGELNRAIQTRHNGTYTTKINSIKHIHGYYDKDMVLGVNDVSQVANEELKKDAQVVDALIKPRCNQATKHLIDRDCINVINNSHMIFIFGSSIGATDRMWWSVIGKRLLSEGNARLVIFYRDTDEPKRNRGYKLAGIERRVKNNFLTMATLADEQKKSIENRVFVAHNTNMFKFELKKTKA